MVLAYHDLLHALEQEFTYTFGGCTILRGLEGSYLSRQGISVKDRVNLIYTDTPFAVKENLTRISHYTDELREAALRALNEEAVLVAMYTVYHAE